MKKYSAVIFDLDGTLAETKLDFALMRKDLGFPADVSILEHLETLPKEKQVIANQIILDHEMRGAHNSYLTRGADKLLNHLEENKIPMAIQTRNCKEVTDLVVEKLSIPIRLILTRENSAPKPDPSGVHEIAKQWNISPSEILYVGDSHYDKKTSQNAKSDFALFINEHNESKDIDHEFKIDCLSELIQYF